MLVVRKKPYTKQTTRIPPKNDSICVWLINFCLMFSNMCVSGFYSNYSSSQNTNGTEYSRLFQCKCMFDLNFNRNCVLGKCSVVVRKYFRHFFLFLNELKTLRFYSSSLNDMFYYVQQMGVKRFSTLSWATHKTCVISTVALLCSSIKYKQCIFYNWLYFGAVTHSEKE